MSKIEHLKAKDVMTRDVVTVKRDTTTEDLMKLFNKHEFNGFPVVRGEKYLGMVYDIYLLRICVPSTERQVHPVVADFWKLFAERTGEIMDRTVPTASPNDDLEYVASKMLESNFKSIPVVDGDRLVGIIALRDIMRHILLEGRE
jgi:CBS domain-containing protein